VGAAAGAEAEVAAVRSGDAVAEAEGIAGANGELARLPWGDFRYNHRDDFTRFETSKDACA